MSVVSPVIPRVLHSASVKGKVISRPFQMHGTTTECIDSGLEGSKRGL